MKVKILEEFYIPGYKKIQKGVEMDMPYETAETLISRGLVKQLSKDTKKDGKTSETAKSDEIEASDVEDAEPKEVKKYNKHKK